MASGLLGLGGGLSSSTFGNAGGAVADIFGGIGAATSTQLQAQGLNIQAEGTQISSESELLQAQGNLAEGQEYSLAENLAKQNEAYTEASTNIQAAQQERQVAMTIGGERAATGGAGLANSGSAGDLLRSSAQQGALAGAVLRMQGQITEAGYNEQAASYGLMATTAGQTAAGEQQIAGQEQSIATQQRQLASDTAAAGKTSEFGDIAAGLLKGAGAVAGLL